jgi:hypothetical protein
MTILKRIDYVYSIVPRNDFEPDINKVISKNNTEITTIADTIITQ